MEMMQIEDSPILTVVAEYNAYHHIRSATDNEISRNEAVFAREYVQRIDANSTRRVLGFPRTILEEITIFCDRFR